MYYALFLHNIFFMRQLISLFCLWMMISCNTKDPETAPTPQTDTVSQEASLRAAVKQYPDSISLLENLVEYYSNNDQNPVALNYIDSAIAKDSSNPRLWDMQSVVLVAQADTAHAITALEHAIELYPDAQYVISLGALYAETKNVKALAMADALLNADKAHANKEAFFIKGLYYSFSNLKEKAIPFFDKALAEDYGFMHAYLEKALALYDLKRYREAADVLNKAVTLQNNFDEGYYYLGQCYEKMGQKEDAANAYRKALMYDPDYTEASDALARLQM